MAYLWHCMISPSGTKGSFVNAPRVPEPGSAFVGHDSRMTRPVVELDVVADADRCHCKT